MPRLNTLGSALSGVSVGLSIDGSVPAAMVGIPIDTARWLTDTLAIYQNDTGPGPAVDTYNVSTGAIVNIDSLGVTRMGAGGGKYAIFVVGAGVRSNIAGLAAPSTAATGDVSEAGIVALNTNYGNGQGINLYDAAGALRFSDPSVTLAPYNDPIPCRSGLVMYCTPPGWLLRTAPTGTLLPCLLRSSVNYAVPVQLASGDIWVLERTNILTLRQKDSTNGYQVNAALSANTFNPDAREISPGVVRVCWSTDAGESPAALQEIDLTVATGANRTATVSGGALVWVNQSPLTPVSIATGQPTLAKWVGWYYASGRYGDFRPIQNCAVTSLDFYQDGSGVVPAGSDAKMLASALAAGACFCSGRQRDIDVMKANWNIVAGLIILDEGDPAYMEMMAAQFRGALATNGLPSRPIISTLTEQQIFGAAWRPPAGVDAYGIEVFFAAPAGSYAAQYAATVTRINQLVAAAVGVPIYLIPQAFDRNGDPAWVAAIDQIAAIIDACGDALKADQ